MPVWVRFISAIIPMGGHSDAVFQQRISDLARAHKSSHVFNLPMVFAVAIAYTSWVDGFLVFAWVIANVIAQGMGVWVAHRFLAATQDNRPLPTKDLAGWSACFGLSTFAYTAAWSASLFLFWNPGVFPNNAFLLAIAAVSLSPTLLQERPLLSNFFVAALTMGGSFLFAIAWFNFNLFALVSASYVAYLFVVCAHALQLNKSNAAATALSIEKSQLIEALSKSKKESDAARMRAEDASRAKSQFLANMSHELRTPLNAIIGFSEVMNKQVFGPMANEKYLQYSEDIHSSGQHLLALINDVLDLSKIEAGQYSLFEEAVDLSIIADDCLRLVNLRAHSARIEIKKRFIAPLPDLRADQRAVRQIWLNLLTNAVKFAPPDSRVTMIIDYLPDGRFYLGVQDEGPGIPQDEFETVLSSFGQGKEGKARPGSGTGLGLAIVRGLLEAHGGHFELESEVGRGTLVRAVFPNRRLIDAPEEQAGFRRAALAYP